MFSKLVFRTSTTDAIQLTAWNRVFLCEQVQSFFIQKKSQMYRTLVRYLVQNISLHFPILSQIHPFYIFLIGLYENQADIILLSTPTTFN